MSGWYNSLTTRRAATRLRAATTRRSRRPAEPGGGLRLQAVPACVPADLDLLTPTMRVVVVEDLCWALARHAWLERRPYWWRPAARRTWATERTALDAKQERLRELAEAARADTVIRD
ncbi:MAG TPA: hypothetical protein VEO01_19075 [Pseudonocardiaceae bacterium]|nr:hypothetical protein [Pseudonocardiaceae bacterium]